MEADRNTSLPPIVDRDEANELLGQLVDELSKRGFFTPARVPVPLSSSGRFEDNAQGPAQFVMAMMEALLADDVTRDALIRLKDAPPEYLESGRTDEEIDRAIDESISDAGAAFYEDEGEVSDEWRPILVQTLIRNLDVHSFLANGRPDSLPRHRRRFQLRRRRQ